jgi:hypothetical protein
MQSFGRRTVMIRSPRLNGRGLAEEQTHPKKSKRKQCQRGRRLLRLMKAHLSL